MTIDELLNQRILTRRADGSTYTSYCSNLAELLEYCKTAKIALGVPTQEQADILNGYALVQGMDNVRVRVDRSTPYIYRQI